MPQDNATLKSLREYLSHLITEKSLVANGIWKDIAENLIPSREHVSMSEITKGKRKATKIYDSSAMIYLNIFVDGFHGNIINQATEWFQPRLPANLQFLEKLPEVRRWLQERKELIYFFLQESNFYAAMRQYIRDGGGIGTASIYVEEDMGNGKLCFYVIHPREFHIAENQYGRVDVMIRKFPMTGRKLIQKFGLKTLPETVKSMIKSNHFSEFETVHAVYPNDEFDSRMIASKYNRFASKWFLYDVKNHNQNEFLAEKGYDDFPYMTWRYFNGENSPYGDSPAVYALPEIMGLQAIGKSLLRAGHMAADPPMNIPSEMQGAVELYPAGFNYYGPDYNRRIYPVTTGINYPIAEEREEKKREILKEHFHVPYFMLLQQMDRTMTAKEVIELTGEKATVISAAVNDFMTVLDSILDYVGHLKTRSGELPPPPDVLLEYIGDRRIPIEYMGPLAQSQKNMFETRGILRSLEIVAPIVQQFPELLDNIDTDGTFLDLLASNGFPQKRINSPDVIKQIRDGRSAQQQEEMRKLDMERFGETLKSFAQADKNSGGRFFNEIQQVLTGNSSQSIQGTSNVIQ